VIVLVRPCFVRGFQSRYFPVPYYLQKPRNFTPKTCAKNIALFHLKITPCASQKRSNSLQLKLITHNPINLNCFSSIKMVPRLPRAHPSLTRPNNSASLFDAKNRLAFFFSFCLNPEPCALNAANHRPLISGVTPKSPKLCPSRQFFRICVLPLTPLKSVTPTCAQKKAQKILG
jgi:hypothetical protein